MLNQTSGFQTAFKPLLESQLTQMRPNGCEKRGVCANVFNQYYSAVDSETSLQTGLNEVDFLAYSAFYITPTSVDTLSLLSHIPPSPGEPYESVLTSICLISSAFFIHYLARTIFPSPLILYGFDAYTVFNPSCCVTSINDVFR